MSWRPVEVCPSPRYFPDASFTDDRHVATRTMDGNLIHICDNCGCNLTSERGVKRWLSADLVIEEEDDLY